MRLHWSVYTSAAGGIIGVALFFSVPADADPDQVVNYAAYNAGRICATLDAYPTLPGVDGLVQAVAHDTGFGAYDTGRVIAIAVTAVCPRHIGLLKRYAYTVSGSAGVAV